MVKRVIIINGPSCAGKTSVAKEICQQSNNLYLHLQVDEVKKFMFTAMDKNSTSRAVGRPICDEILIQTAKVFLRNSKNVVIDTTFDGSDALEIAKFHLAAFDQEGVLFVGITCPLDVRLERYKTYNDNSLRSEKAIIAQSDVFDLSKGSYDLEYDSNISTSKEIAKNILSN